jgi:type IV pilus assembly protein PilC
VPVFANMYDGMGIPLPTPTRVIMNASDFMRGSGGLTLLLILTVSYVVFKYLTTKNEKIKFWWHGRVLKMPIFGEMILKSMLARISLIMGNLSAAGVNLLESIEIAKSISTNVVISNALENVKKGVFSGDTLTKLFLKEPLFPPTFSQLISVGEQTGSLDEMFTSVSNYYEEEFDTAVDNMSTLIEPIMIVFMGTMIGGLMIAMYSPIFNVGALIG